MSRHRLHIGMLAPPYFPVPPAAYGGVEAVLATLSDALVELGHRVTLVSAGANGTRAEHVQTFPEASAARLSERWPELVHVAEAQRAFAMRGVDVIHDHTHAGLLLAGSRSVPTIATIHNPVVGDLRRLLAALDERVHLVAISDAQRQLEPGLPWAATVHNALDARNLPFEDRKDDYVLFLGRMAKEKGVTQAIAAARAAGRRIVIAAKCSEPAEHAYFAGEVAPLLEPGSVDYLGEVSGAAKFDLLARASALVFPIAWDEPFGMVMIEALACGTPVVATRRGAVQEILEHGVTGIICDGPEDVAAGLERARALRPAACRAAVERRFGATLMARRYERVYMAALADAAIQTAELALLSPAPALSAIPPEDFVGGLH